MRRIALLGTLAFVLAAPADADTPQITDCRAGNMPVAAYNACLARNGQSQTDDVGPADAVAPAEHVVDSVRVPLGMWAREHDGDGDPSDQPDRYAGPVSPSAGDVSDRADVGLADGDNGNADDEIGMVEKAMAEAIPGLRKQGAPDRRPLSGVQVHTDQWHQPKDYV